MITVVNQSKALTDHEVEAMVHAVGVQLARDVAPIWGLTPALEFSADGSVAALSSPCFIIDQPDVEGALGYHDEDEAGVSYIKVFTAPTLENGGTAFTGPESISVTLSHEICELIGDGPANKWADGPDGSDFAFELCDAVEGDAYEIGGVSVSNFLYPAFFDPKAAPGSKLDFLGKLHKPFDMTAGGYQIKRTEPGKESEVYAKHAQLAIQEMNGGVFVVFGSTFPHWKRALKLRKALARGRVSP